MCRVMDRFRRAVETSGWLALLVVTLAVMVWSVPLLAFDRGGAGAAFWMTFAFAAGLTAYLIRSLFR